MCFFSCYIIQYVDFNRLLAIRTQKIKVMVFHFISEKITNLASYSIRFMENYNKVTNLPFVHVSK